THRCLHGIQRIKTEAESGPEWSGAALQNLPEFRASNALAKHLGVRPVLCRFFSPRGSGSQSNPASTLWPLAGVLNPAFPHLLLNRPRQTVFRLLAVSPAAEERRCFGQLFLEALCLVRSLGCGLQGFVALFLGPSHLRFERLDRGARLF